MKRYLWLCLLLCCGGMLTAQNSIFDELARKAPNYGTVTIHQSDAIRKLVGAATQPAEKGESNSEKSESTSKNTTSTTEKEPDNSEIVAMENPEGHVYRVQVYSGNNQRQSKQDVKTMEAQIKRAFPKVNVYPNFKAPVWKLYVGEFATYEEASYMRDRLRKTFPSYRGMKIVHADLPKTSSGNK